MKKFGGWLAGIIGAIIAGYVLWYFTRTPPPPAMTTFEGMIYTESSAIPKAMVSVSLKGNGANGGPFHNVTDQNGSYRIDFTGLPTNATATLRVVATGFRDSTPVSLSNPSGQDNRHDVQLTSLTAPPSAITGFIPHLPGGPQMPRYVGKAAEQATRIRLR